MSKNDFNKNELLRYIHANNVSLRAVVDGLKFALTPYVNSRTLRQQNIPYEIDDKGITNVIIKPTMYPHTQEVFKIPNFTQFIERNLTDSITSFKRIAVPSYYDDTFRTDNYKSDGIIFNPTENKIDKLGFRAKTAVFNLKDKGENATDFDMIFEGEDNESTFLTIHNSSRININYESIKGNLSTQSRSLEFNMNNEYYNNNKVYEPYKGSIPIVELDGGMLSLPYGISFSAKNRDYRITKEYDSVVHRAKHDISMYFGESYFGEEGEEDVLKNNFRFNNTSFDINGKQYMELNNSNGSRRNNVLLKNFDIENNTFSDNLFEDNYFRSNYFESLHWTGNNINRMTIGSEYSPFVNIKNINYNSEVVMDTYGFKIEVNDSTPIRLRKTMASIFNMYANNIKTYFTKLTSFEGDTYFNGEMNINKNMYVNEKAFFSEKVGINSSLYVSKGILSDAEGYFGKDLTSYGTGVFHTGLHILGGKVTFNTGGGSTDNPDMIFNSGVASLNANNLSLNGTTLNMLFEQIKLMTNDTETPASGKYRILLIDDNNKIVTNSTDVAITIT